MIYWTVAAKSRARSNKSAVCSRCCLEVATQLHGRILGRWQTEKSALKYWEIIADNLSKAGWSWGCVSAVDSNGRMIFVAHAHRGGNQRFVVRADEKLTAFMELEPAICACGEFN
jgi:hypothetical protein